MRLRGLCCGLLMCVMATAIAADLVERIIQVPVQIRDTTGAALAQDIVVTVFEEPGRAFYPLLVLNHGCPTSDRTSLNRVRYSEAARFFAGGGGGNPEPVPEIRVRHMGTAGPGFSRAAGFSRAITPADRATVWAFVVSPAAVMR